MAARVSRQHRQPCRACRSAFVLELYRRRILRTLSRNTGSAACATWQQSTLRSVLTALAVRPQAPLLIGFSLANCPCHPLYRMCQGVFTQKKVPPSASLSQLASHGRQHCAHKLQLQDGGREGRMCSAAAPAKGSPAARRLRRRGCTARTACAGTAARSARPPGSRPAPARAAAPCPGPLWRPGAPPTRPVYVYMLQPIMCNLSQVMQQQCMSRPHGRGSLSLSSDNLRVSRT